MKRQMLKVIPLILILTLVVGCASLIKNSYVTLNSSRDFYHTAMTIVADLQNQGVISAEQRTEINVIARIYLEAHNLAVDALEVYATTDAAEDKDKLIVAMAGAAAKWAQLAALVNSIRADSLPATLEGGLT